MNEVDLTWGQVVESDEVYSAKTDRWYEIQQRVTLANGQVKIKAKGVPKYWPPFDPDKPVRVRRGPTGRAVDVFQIVFSGAIVPETVGISRKVGPTLDDTVKEKDE